MPINKNIRNNVIRDYSQSTISIRNLARKYNVSITIIGKIIKNIQPVYYNYIH